LAGKAISTQVGGQGFAYILRNGHPVLKQSLASNEDFAGSPVDVLEPESDHFPGAKTKTGKQKKDGVGAAAGRHATVAGIEDTFDFLRSQVLGHAGQPPIHHREYRSGQVGL
jgi:hypothetical protein